MQVVARVGPYRLFFYSSEGTDPIHVHAERDDRAAKFWVEPVELASSGGFGAAELRKIEALVTCESAASPSRQTSCASTLRTDRRWPSPSGSTPASNLRPCPSAETTASLRGAKASTGQTWMRTSACRASWGSPTLLGVRQIRAQVAPRPSAETLTHANLACRHSASGSSQVT
jgi:hypothetical protein